MCSNDCQTIWLAPAFFVEVLLQP